MPWQPLQRRERMRARREDSRGMIEIHSVWYPYLRMAGYNMPQTHTSTNATYVCKCYTLNTMWRSMSSPFFPGNFPVKLAGVRSNRFAPVSEQTACTSIFFPVPLGPVNISDLTRGAFSWTAWEPAASREEHQWSAVSEYHTL